jgi:hypothetical protein
MKRPYGTGQLYEKSGSYYGRWRTPDGRRLNRRLGSVRAPETVTASPRAQAERMFRKIQADEATNSRAKAKRKRAVTVDLAGDALRERLAIEGARLSYRTTPSRCSGSRSRRRSASVGSRPSRVRTSSV